MNDENFKRSAKPGISEELQVLFLKNQANKLVWSLAILTNTKGKD
jgi:hypothetical protein